MVRFAAAATWNVINATLVPARRPMLGSRGVCSERESHAPDGGRMKKVLRMPCSFEEHCLERYV
jgi:hypothetical protein